MRSAKNTNSALVDEVSLMANKKAASATGAPTTTSPVDATATLDPKLANGDGFGPDVVYMRSAHPPVVSLTCAGIGKAVIKLPMRS